MNPPKSRINIEVTEKDIERAHKNDSYNCVVAQAIARTVTDATRIEVDSQSIRYTRDGARYIFLTPYAVQGYVIAFDAGEPVEPFSFQLRNPQRVARRSRTDAGKQALREYKRAGKAKDVLPDPVAPAKAKAKDVLPDPVAPAKKSRAVDKNADARAAYAASAAKTNEPMTTTHREPGERTAPPRVFKSKQRSYGHRLLRINQ